MRRKHRIDMFEQFIRLLLFFVRLVRINECVLRDWLSSWFWKLHKHRFGHKFEHHEGNFLFDSKSHYFGFKHSQPMPG
jgi:hypothetical protein